MLMVSKGRRQYSKQQGDLAEKRFIDACEAVGYQVRKATAQEDIYEHIDYWVLRKENWYGVDVKGNRHPETIWVEFKNVRGNEGWLHGSATFIAFDIAEEGGFAVILREELVDWCLLNVDNTFVGKNEAYRKLYQREGREDVLTKIHLTDLKELNSFKLLRYATT
jgi:hypothetical protein